jgi:hypothetical protein
MTVYKHRFDFEIGYLVNSPCKNCKKRAEFPKCISKCVVLDRIHTALAGVIASAKNRQSA